MKDKLSQMEAEQMAMQLKGQEAEIEEEDVKGKFSGSESDSDFISFRLRVPTSRAASQ